MVITGQLIADSRVNKTKGGKQVVNFCVAVRDSYKTKDAEETTRVTAFFNCSYWVSASIAQHLVKGAIVELSGRVSVNAWNTAEGEAKASLNFHVNNIKLHGGNKASVKDSDDKEAAADTANAGKENDDLPF